MFILARDLERETGVIPGPLEVPAKYARRECRMDLTELAGKVEPIARVYYWLGVGTATIAVGVSVVIYLKSIRGSLIRIADAAEIIAGMYH